jgi:tetratricopeptide (TPR) repeat protein
LAGDLQKSLTHSRRAARNAERVFAHDEALKFLEQARESAAALNRADELAAVDEQIGDIHEARGMIRLAVESYERALSGAATRQARAAIKARIGNAYVPVGDPRGLACLEQALSELDAKTQTNALALATALVGRYYHYRTEHRKAIEFLERARQLAEPLGDPETLCNIYSYLAGAHQHLLQYVESDRWARVSIALGERTKFPAAIALGNEFLAENAGGRGHWDNAAAFAAQDEEQGRKIGSLARVAWSGFPRVQAFHGKGELVAARAAALAALGLCEQIGEERLATWLDPALATVLADLSDDEAARTVAERGWARARQLDQLVLTAWALHALGYAAMRRGDVHGAVEWYDQFVTLMRDSENGVARNVVLGRAAEAFLRGGRVDDAARLADQAVAVAEFANAPHYLAVARRVHGQILVVRERHDEALRMFDDAIAVLDGLGSRLELARALYQRALLRQTRGERGAASADATRARDEFAASGAARGRALAEELLRE